MFKAGKNLIVIFVLLHLDLKKNKGILTANITRFYIVLAIRLVSSSMLFSPYAFATEALLLFRGRLASH